MKVITLLTASVCAIAAAGTAAGDDAEVCWRSATTEDYSVVTNLDAAALQSLVGNLRRFEPVADGYMPGNAAAERAPLTLLVFDSRRSFQQHFGTRNFTGVMQPSLQSHSLAIAPERGRSRLLVTAYHEYSHYLLRNRLDVSVPAWFDEGLASLLASMTFSDNTATLGRLPLERMQELFVRDEKFGRPLTLQQVLNTDSVFDMRQDLISKFYGWSWLTTHYLLLGHLKGAADQRANLVHYLEDREHSLPDYLNTSYRSLRRQLSRYVRGRVPTASHMSAAVDAPRLEANCLQPIERDIVLAEAMLTHNPAGSIRLLQPYRAAQPDDATLLVLTARALAQQHNIEEALALAERAHKLAPENPDAIINLGDLLVYGCVLTNAPECTQKWQRALPLFRRALKLDRSRIDAVFGLGLSNLYLGKAGDAVNYLRVVYSKVPWAIHVNFYLGESLRIIGDSRARTYLTNARNWAQNDIWSKLASAALAKLDND